MNIDKKVFEIMSSETGIPKEDFAADKFLAKDLGISDIEIKDIIENLSAVLGFEINLEGKELKTVGDILLVIHESQPLT